MALIHFCQRIQLRFCTFLRDFFTLWGPFESHSFHAGKNKDHCLDVLEFPLDLIGIFKYLRYLDKETTDCQLTKLHASIGETRGPLHQWCSKLNRSLLRLSTLKHFNIVPQNKCYCANSKTMDPRMLMFSVPLDFFKGRDG